MSETTHMGREKLRRAIILFFAASGVAGLLASYQNCGQVAFQKMTPAGAISNTVLASKAVSICDSGAGMPAPVFQVLPQPPAAGQDTTLLLQSPENYQSLTTTIDEIPGLSFVRDNPSLMNQAIVLKFPTSRTYRVRSVGTDACSVAVNTVQSVFIGTYSPLPAIQLSTNPVLTSTPLVGTPSILFKVDNATSYSNPLVWYEGGGNMGTGTQATKSFGPGTYTVKVQTNDLYNNTVFNSIDFCIAKSGDPDLTFVNNSPFTVNTSVSFSVPRATDYASGSVSINFGDGSAPVTVMGAGLVSHTFTQLTPEGVAPKIQVSAIDTCMKPRTKSYSYAVIPANAACTPIPDGCKSDVVIGSPDSQKWCTGRTSCGGAGVCDFDCRCGWAGLPVGPFCDSQQRRCTTTATTCQTIPTKPVCELVGSCNNGCGYKGSVQSTYNSCPGGTSYQVHGVYQCGQDEVIGTYDACDEAGKFCAGQDFQGKCKVSCKGSNPALCSTPTPPPKTTPTPTPTPGFCLGGCRPAPGCTLVSTTRDPNDPNCIIDCQVSCPTPTPTPRSCLGGCRPAPGCTVISTTFDPNDPTCITDCQVSCPTPTPTPVPTVGDCSRCPAGPKGLKCEMVSGLASPEACCNAWAIDKTVAINWQYSFKGSPITCGQPSTGGDGCSACPADPSMGLACRFFPATTMAECCSAAGAFLGGALWETTFNGQPLSCGGSK